MVKSKIYWADKEKLQKISQDELILFMSMFNDISCGTKDNERECLANAKVVSFMERGLEKDNGHSLVQVPKKRYSIKKESPQVI